MASPSETPSSRVTFETVGSAVNALLKWKEAKTNSEKPQLLPEDDFLYLSLALKKIPPKGGRTNPYKIPLPHPLVDDSLSSELCLIIDDRPKSNLTSGATKKKVKSEGIPVSKVLKFSKLKTDYKPFEAKRKLCDSYDLFFADKRVIPLLPKLLGKQFFKKKKLPLPVDLTHKNWKDQIERGCSSAFLHMKNGTCSVIKVGKVSMESGEIVENVVDAINGVIEFVPKRWEGVRSLHLKFSDSLALPVYQSVPDMKLKIAGIKDNVEEIEEDGGIEGEVKEDTEKDGKFGKKGKKKGRIHEVRYMDASVDEDELGIDIDGDENEMEKSEDDDLGSDEIMEKKRKKGALAKGRVFSELNEGKPEKKVGKVRKGGRVDGKDEKEDEKSENVDPSSAEFETKKKKKKGNSTDKGQVKLTKKKSKNVDGEEQKKGQLALKNIEESGEKKGKRKSDAGKKVKNLTKIKKSKKKQSA